MNSANVSPHSWGRLAVIVAVALSCAATLWRLGDSPPGLFIDEVAISLTARSLWESGEDLAGNRLPIFPLSFPDRAAPMPVNPVYTYTAIPFALAGPGPWSARLPAVLWLWLAAFSIGLLAAEVTGEKAIGAAIGVTSALSPWLFVLGRVGWEAVSFPAILGLAVWALLRAARLGAGAGPRLVLAGILFGLTLYSYSTARLLAPLLAVTCSLPFLRPELSRRHVAGFSIAFALMGLPLLVFMSNHPGVLTWRFEEMSLWRSGDSVSMGTIAGPFIANYLGYFSPGFLFFSGDANLRHGTGTGVLPWVWAPLLAVGLLEVWRRKSEPRVRAVLGGLLMAPVGAALVAIEEPHAIRSIGAIVFWAALAALGLKRLIDWLPSRQATVITLACLAALESGVFLHDYFGDYRGRSFESFQADRDLILREAFRRRGGRPLYVPMDLHGDVRHSVALAYWGRLPTESWRREGLEPFDVYPWRGQAPPGSLVIVRAGDPSPPSDAQILFAVARGNVIRYSLVEIAQASSP